MQRSLNTEKEKKLTCLEYTLRYEPTMNLMEELITNS